MIQNGNLLPYMVKSEVMLFEFNSRVDHGICMKLGMQMHLVLAYKRLLQISQILSRTGDTH